ncbi:hypothetical protein FNO01nite_30440 [Flavobacterium noncentrifugens]|uniref:Uncharacterized protein n=1 Tax=Flavobacterium noncentrifugens TaxID=1128970 RepID=A0A1G9BUC7_9FLAO|nr:hypothetical protein [Flavobacterium noncentrifugens]GEP52372.1 hypothetical protein FNO01nite_30440 [Flavobacterium noncentrifugens]SDK43078.1 hypothetical protein SAMN04487935_3357 [Flavobacterium noncentrifugens]
MPANFPDVWLDRVIENIDNADVAPWLDNITELDADITVFGEGSANETNVIHVASTDFEVDVLINNNTYPIPVQEYADGTLSFSLDKLQTKVVTVSDDQVIGASYDKIDTVTKKGTKAITSAKYAKALHSIAPASHTANTPVLVATGGPDGLQDSTGRKRLTYEDLVEFARLCRIAGFVEGEMRLVPNSNHYADLALDRKNFGNLISNHVKGTPAPVVAGFEIYPPYKTAPKYTSANVKKAYGAIAAAGDKDGTVAFSPEGIAKKTGLTKQYFQPAATNPHGQTNDLAYRHYFLCVPFRARLVGAIL